MGAAREVIALFDEQPAAGEIIVESGKPFRFAERVGRTEESIASMRPKGDACPGSLLTAWWPQAAAKPPSSTG